MLNIASLESHINSCELLRVVGHRYILLCVNSLDLQFCTRHAQHIGVRITFPFIDLYPIGVSQNIELATTRLNKWICGIACKTYLYTFVAS